MPPQHQKQLAKDYDLIVMFIIFNLCIFASFLLEKTGTDNVIISTLANIYAS